MLSAVDIFAAGSTNEETIQLKIDDVVVQTWENVGGDAEAGQFVKLSYSTDQQLTPGRIKIAFVNDKYAPEQGIDRNVRVDAIAIDGVRFETESTSVFSTGTWKASDGIQPGFRQDEYLHSNGEFRFSDRTLLEIHARGETGAEVMNLKIDGVVVGSWQTSQTMQTYVFESNTLVTPDRVRIEFTNDLYQPEMGVDRNLIVDKIVINGVAVETESAQVFSTGTWRAADGIAPGFRQSEFLHTNGYFQFDLAKLGEIQRTDGVGNNLENPLLGAANLQFARVAPAAYTDGLNAPSLTNNPNPRDISNAVSAQSQSIENDRFITSVWFQWGQFLDHDIAQSFSLDRTLPVEPFPINSEMAFTRSPFDRSTGITTPREQLNFHSSYIDGGAVYGVNPATTAALRAKVGGKMASTITSAGELLPLSSQGFIAGDVRVNENIALAALQTLWVREHNRIASELAAKEYQGRDLNDAAVDEEIFQRARQIVTALIQHITYNEFLPSTIGFNAIPTYKGYNPNVDPTISNEFSTIMYRLGHTTLPDEFLIGTAGEKISLRDAFGNTAFITQRGIDEIFSGIVTQKMQEVDNYVVDGVRNFLNAGPGGFDLVARNIQRGRDHGMPDFNTIREAIGLNRVSSFHEIISDEALANKFTELYGSPDNADPWIVAISEDHVPGTSVGMTMYRYMVDQFTRLRDGDRFYFENYLDAKLIAEVKSTRLSDIINRNTGVTVQAEVFWTPDTLVFRNNLDNKWLIRDFGDKGGVEVVFLGTPGVRDPNNLTEVVTARRDQPINAVVVAGTNELGDGFFVPNQIVRAPQADQGVDEFVVTANIDFFEAYGLGGNDRWVIESDVASVFASGDAGDDILAVKSFAKNSRIELTGGAGHDQITVLAPAATDLNLDGGSDSDVIVVYTSRGSEFTLNGHESASIVTADSSNPSASENIKVDLQQHPLEVKNLSYHEVVRRTPWSPMTSAGWKSYLNYQMNVEFEDDFALPKNLNVRVLWNE